MTAEPKKPYRVALEGFSAFERAAVASFFRLADQRLTTYVQADSLAESDLVVADTDEPVALAAVLAAWREGDAVFVGAQPPPGTMLCLARPVDPVQIVRELDALVEQRQPLPTFSAPRLPEEDLVPEDLDLDLTLASTPDHPVHRGRPRVPTTTRLSGGGRDALVVDDSSIARKFLKHRLEGLGYRVQLASDGEQALEMITHHVFALVLVDLVLGPPTSVDGLQVCHFAKQRQGTGRAVPPGVVVVTGQTGSMHRVRASLAGCDAFLTKPLREDEFVKTLIKVDPLFRTKQPVSMA